MKKLLFLLSLAVGFGCSTTNTVTMSVKEPAVVELPTHMEQIGVISRSDTGNETSAIERIDKILSAEGLKLDDTGVRYSLDGLTEELLRHELFEHVDAPSTEQIDNPSFGVFPAALPWDEVAKISQNHQIDGLFSLEFYDTDTKIDYDASETTIDGPLNLDVPMLEHEATVVTTIKTGWRIYDARAKQVMDEYIITERFTTSGKGVNPVKAASAITGRNEIVKELSRDIGRFYAERTLPFWTRVKREYYVKGSSNLERAKRRAQTGNWNGAAELWKEDTDHPDAKIAGRAHYNMAIINEINGDLDSAIDWARIAYEDFGDKRALNYVRTLERRKKRVAALD